MWYYETQVYLHILGFPTINMSRSTWEVFDTMGIHHLTWPWSCPSCPRASPWYHHLTYLTLIRDSTKKTHICSYDLICKMYIYIYIYTRHIYIYMTYIYMTYIYIYVYVIYIYIYMSCIYIYMSYIYICHIYIYMYDVYIYIYTCISLYVYTYIEWVCWTPSCVTHNYL